MTTGTVKCQWCHTPVVKMAREIYNGKSYHDKCVIEIKARDALFAYVCEKQFLVSPGPQIMSQRKAFIAKYGYTDDDMLKAARYIHEVIQKDKYDEQYQGTIGLIPHVMDEALEYWKQEEARQKRIADRYVEVGEPQEHIIKVNKLETRAKPIRGLIDPNTIILEEGE